MTKSPSLPQAIKALGAHQAIDTAKAAAKNAQIAWDDGIGTVFQQCLNFPELCPTFRGRFMSHEATVEKWVHQYHKGYTSRISQRVSSPIGTIPDPMVDTIIQERLPHLSNQLIQKIRLGHRLSMSGENILGLLLEEYLATHLTPLNWHCAWGETLRSVDFCHASGRLLQVKNKSNSENSSSSRVREGTTIEKWHRMDATRGTFEWAKLSTLCGSSDLSEDGFEAFVRQCIQNNPQALFVEHEELWQL